MKVAINDMHGGFSLSDAAFQKLLDRKSIDYMKILDDNNYPVYWSKTGNTEQINEYEFYQNRGDSDLISVIEEMGSKANGIYASIRIIEIPNDIKWHIAEFGGREHVAEDHRTWY